MKLGMLVNTNKNLDAVVGLTKAALSKGHEVVIFTMDEGTKLFGNPAYTALCGMKGVSMSFCDHSAKGLNAPTQGVPAEIVCGSQFNNAAMDHESDKVIVL
ncbi:MAG: hypothetical protein AB1805_16720 [Nitrospirota bacterium]